MGERGAPRGGTPTSHLKAHLALVTQFTQQARAGLERDSDTVRIFLAIYAGFLVEAGAGVRWLLEPSVMEQATVAIRRLAPEPGAERDTATRLLATLWASGVVTGLGTEDWTRHAPELPAICLRLAALVQQESPGDTEGGQVRE